MSAVKMPQAYSLINNQGERLAALASSKCNLRAGSQQAGSCSLNLKSRRRTIPVGRVIRAEAQVEATEAEKEAWERRKVRATVFTLLRRKLHVLRFDG